VWYALKAGSKSMMFNVHPHQSRSLPSSSTRMDTTIGSGCTIMQLLPIQTLILREKKPGYLYTSTGATEGAAFTTRNGVVNRGHAGVQRSVRKVKESRTDRAGLILATRNTGVKPRLQVQTKP
jgi:hypothetical protein